MKVKLATQTFSSSTAVALQFLQQKIKHEKFINCTDTIVSVRNIDPLFDFLNSRYPASSGFISTIRLSNFEEKKAAILEICNYLLSLKDPDMYPLSQHRRKTFIIVFVGLAKSILSGAEELFFRSDNPYKYLLTYKLSQDHLEMFFSCVSGRGRFNNNPNALQLKYAFRKILLHNAITSSDKSNVMMFEENLSGSLFSFKTNRRRSRLSEMTNKEALNGVTDADTLKLDQESIENALKITSITFATENVLYYIARHILRSILKSIECDLCVESLLVPKQMSDHQYFTSPHGFLVQIKNSVGLIQSSYFVYKIIKTAEKIFHLTVVDNPLKITSNRVLVLKMLYHIVKSCKWDKYIENSERTYQVEITSDDHITQLVKRISSKYLHLWLNTYGKIYTREIINKS